jgi:hypothetical protein
MKPKTKRTIEACIYCSSGEGGSVDHIPPQCFFAKPYPPDLLTVPCCEPCRLLDQKADQHMRNLFISFETTEQHPSVLSQLAGRRNEAMKEQPHKADDLMRMMTSVPTLGPEGKIKVKMAFNMDDPLVNRFVERVSRGVLYSLFGTAYFDAIFEWGKGKPGGFAELASFIPQRHVGSVFSCTGSPEGFVALDFYASFPLWGRFTRKLV